MGPLRQGITGMDPLTLRARQSPLKVPHRADPSSALVRLRAQGALDGEALQCRGQTSTGVVRAGLHVATGGGARSCGSPLQAQPHLRGLCCCLPGSLPLRGRPPVVPVCLIDVIRERSLPQVAEALVESLRSTEAGAGAVERSDVPTPAT